MPEALRPDVRLLGALSARSSGVRRPGPARRRRAAPAAGIAAHGDDEGVAAGGPPKTESGASGRMAGGAGRAGRAGVHRLFPPDQPGGGAPPGQTLRAADQSDDQLSGAVGAAVDEVAGSVGRHRLRRRCAGLELRPSSLRTPPRPAAALSSPRSCGSHAPERSRRRPARRFGSGRDRQRRLLEEIDLLWRTAHARPRRWTRSTRFVPPWRPSTRRFSRWCRRLPAEDSLDRVRRSGTRASRAAALPRFGCWIGGDRDGNPYVTAQVTREAIMIQCRARTSGTRAPPLRIGRS